MHGNSTFRPTDDGGRWNCGSHRARPFSAPTPYNHGSGSGETVEHALNRIMTRSGCLTLAQRYGATVGISALFMLAALGTEWALGRAPLIVMLPATIVIALLFGQRAGYVATALLAVFIILLVAKPTGSLAITDPTDMLRLLLFIGVGAALSALGGLVRRAMARLAAAEQDKDLLLREIRHRLQNDLQGLSLYLSALAHRSGEGEASGALLTGADRITVLARIYSRLERENEVAVVNSKEFIETLCDDLRHAQLSDRPIRLGVAAEPSVIGLDCGVALGLIINELVTNAAKYAFPQDREGEIQVRFHRVGADYVLTVADDGVGTAEEPETAPDGSGLGQHLVRQIAGQIDGRVTRDGSRGTSVTIQFPAASAIPYIRKAS